MIRIAVLGLSHEANTFSPHLVDDAYIEATGVLRGQEIMDRHLGGTSTVSGFLSALASYDDIEVVPLVFTQLVPAGRITAEALAIRADELVTALRYGGPFDGVLASLHGAAVAEDVHDVDGYLLRCFREEVGPDVPIGVSLDLHANVSAEMCRYADVLNTYRTNPHVDAKEVAEEVAELIVRTVRGVIRPTTAYRWLPAAINILCQNTDESPMRDIFAEAREIQGREGVLSVTVAEGYPYADVPEMGMSVVVITDDDQAAAERQAYELASKVWERHEAFDTVAPSATEALRLVEKSDNRPILLLDVGDNIGGGSPGDSVVLLNAARELGFADLLTIIADPVSADRCHAARVGGELELSIAAQADPAVGPPVDARATVLALHHGVHQATGPVHAGMRHFDGGPTAAVRLDTGQTVILTSKAVPPLSIATLEIVGLRPDQFAAIVGKGVHSPLAGYGLYVADIIRVDTPGVTTADPRRFDHVNRRRPMFPFEPDATYPVTTDEGAHDR